MRFTYECEQCFEEFESGDREVHECNGDGCREEVCANCCKKCKNPECKRYVCNSCLEGRSARYCGEYCIDCAMWATVYQDESGDADEQWHNFDYVKNNMTKSSGLKYLKDLDVVPNFRITEETKDYYLNPAGMKPQGQQGEKQ